MGDTERTFLTSKHRADAGEGGIKPQRRRRVWKEGGGGGEGGEGVGGDGGSEGGSSLFSFGSVDPFTLESGHLLSRSDSDEPDSVSKKNSHDMFIAHVTKRKEFIERARLQQRKKQLHSHSDSLFKVYLLLGGLVVLMCTQTTLWWYLSLREFTGEYTVEIVESAFYRLVIFVIVPHDLWRFYIYILPMVCLKLTGLMSFTAAMVGPLLYWMLKLRNQEVVWKFKFWLLVGTIFKFNKALVLKFADFVREMSPHLAPCNALQDDVSCTATISTFIARTVYYPDTFPINAMVISVGVAEHAVAGEQFSQEFYIGEGSVFVMKLSKDQYSFTCVVRGELLEEFEVITDWKRMGRILQILEFWQASPKVGVIENLTLWRDGIYCHALNMKEIVEGVLENYDYFSIYNLPEERRFFVGCGKDRMLGSKEAAGGDSMWTLYIATIAAITCFYQLKSSYPKVAIGSLVIFLVVTAFKCGGRLFMQICFYWLCTLLFCFNAKWRLGVYIWMKKRDIWLAYSDEFNPDQLRPVDDATEVIYLSNSLRKPRKALALKKYPDWTKFPTINTGLHNLGNSDIWHERWRNGNQEVRFKLFAFNNGYNQSFTVTFMMEFTYSNCFAKSRRMVLVRSEYGAGHPTCMRTDVSLDEMEATYNWSMGSFHLFVYLMLLWGRRNHGVIQSFQSSMFRNYNHVFSVHGLAAHIENLKLDHYYLLLPDPITQSTSDVSTPALPV